MKTSFKKLPGSKIALEVVLDVTEFKQYYDAAEAEALANVELKGFRRGTAPKELAEKAIDRDAVFSSAARAAIRETLDGETEHAHWTLIDQPKIEILEASPQGSVGLKYRAELTVLPEVKLGDYKRIARDTFGKQRTLQVSDEEIDKSIQWLRDSRASIVKVDRGAEKGDLIDINLKSSLGGTPIQGAEQKNDRFVLGESHLVPGFDEKLERGKAGEQIVFSLSVPPDHWNKDLRGKTVDFTVDINAVYERTVPPLTDAFAQGIGQAFKTVSGLKTSVRDGLRLEKEEKERERARIEALDAIAKASTMDIPDIMVQRTLDRLAADFKQMGGGAGSRDEDVRTSLQDTARRQVAGHLVIYNIAQAEHLTPTEEEVIARAKQEHLDPATHYDYSYGVVQNEKLFAFLESQAHAKISS